MPLLIPLDNQTQCVFALFDNHTRTKSRKCQAQQFPFASRRSMSLYDMICHHIRSSQCDTNRNEMPCRSTTPSASIGGRPIICPKWKEWWTMGRVYYFKHRKEKRSVIGGVLRNALNNLRWKWHKMTTCEQGRWVENELHTASSQIEKPVRKASFFFRLQAWSTSKSTSRGEQRLQKQNSNIPLSEISKWHIIL